MQKNLIQNELALAGQPSMVPPEVLALDKRRITPDKVLPTMQFLFRLFGSPCLPRGELVAVTGKAKSGKTFVTSMLMTMCARSEVLSFRRQQPSQEATEPSLLRLLWIDTEQSEESTQDIICHRIIPMGGARLFEGDSPSVVLNLRGECWQDRLPMLETAVTYYRPDLVIVDGIRDLINDINDGVLAQSVLERLMHLASAVGCCMVCVLHQNKSAEDHNLRGWIGTELMNKAFEVYACEKLMPQRIFTLEQKMTRKYDIPDIMYYRVGSDGLPVLTSAPVASQSASMQQKESYPRLNSEYIKHDENGDWSFDLLKIFNQAMSGMETKRHQDLQTAVAQLTNVKSYQKLAEIFQDAINGGVLIKEMDSTGHVLYRLAPL